MIINRWKKAEIKEIERTAIRIDESSEHEREPELDIQRTNITQITDPNEGIKIHNITFKIMLNL